MKMLALEFSSSRRSVAVGEAVLEDTAARWRLLGEAAETGGRSTRALSLIGRVLDAAGVDRELIESVVVGLGPGSYTGIRAAIATAQGWELAGGARLLGVSSVEAMARQLWTQGARGQAWVVLDAQRQEFYAAGYELSDEGPRASQPLHLASRATIEAWARAGERLAGPDLACWFPEAQPLYPGASTLAMLAAGRRDYVPGEALEPIYLRAVSYVKAPLPRFRGAGA